MCTKKAGKSSMRNVYTVRQVNNYIRNMFTQDFMLNRIYIKGEVSNCKYHTSGHIYFSLKDESGTIACVMFASARAGLSFRMKEGQNVIVSGTVSVYERDGKYQLYAKEIMLDGAGLLYERFEALKQELEEMGMFAPEYKQPIPQFAKKVGIVTAPTGAAVRDIIQIAARRNPYVQLILYPALVQGKDAAPSIVKGIEMLDKMGLDVLIVGRGGGSIEDLWAFNEESVARAIFQCSTPVISAVGHETDFTIADFVADMRASTPSAAAELAVADVVGVLEHLRIYRQQFSRQMREKLEYARSNRDILQKRLEISSPQNQIRENRQRLMEYENRLQERVSGVMQRKKHQMLLYVERMKGLSPLDKLKQGYSYTMNEQGKTLTEISGTAPGENIRVFVSNGQIRARVETVETVWYAEKTQKKGNQ